jgi:Septum formation
MKILLRVVIIGAVLIGGFVFRDRISGGASGLQVGDCFDVPASDDFSEVQHHPCSEPHTGEVVYVGDHPAAKGTPFTESLLFDFVHGSCIPALTDYIGTTEGDRIEIGAVYPGSKGWTDGDRKITCYAYLVDGSSLSTSFKAS